MEYLFHIAIIVSIYGILALAQSLVMGSTGLLTLAGPAFYGIGAYVAAILSTKADVSIFLSIIIAPIVAGVIALVAGSTFSRFRDDYFLLATLGFLMIFNTVVRNWEWLTGGSYGIAGISKPEVGEFIFNTPFSFMWLAIIVLIFVFLVSRGLSHSSFGRALNAIREDEDALSIFGYRTSVYKLFAFTIGAMMSSVAGVLFASYITFIDANLFTINESILLWAMIILGGLGKYEGAVLGAALLIIIPELLRFVGFPVEIAGLMRQAMYGLILLFLMLYRPKGIMGKYKV